MNDATAVKLPSYPDLTAFDLGACQAFVGLLESLWNARNVTPIMRVFAEDAEVEYADVPSIKGHAEIRSFLQGRFDGLSDYHLRKRLRLMMPPLLCIELNVRWSSLAAPKMIHRTRAFEILTIAESRIAKWELVSNPHPMRLK